ncbi:MAG: permease [Microbacterium sp.]|jgi:hypothetical protein|nr:permease [Microbacterium sp.]
MTARMIRQVLSLSLRNEKGSRSTVILPLVAFAIVTALILVLFGGAQTFWAYQDEVAMMYQALAVIALALLLPPMLSLGGAAARLSAGRRDERLATLRLLGVTSSVIRIATVIESAAIALLGAILGSIGSFALLPLIALVPFRGAPLGFAAVVPPLWGFAAVAATVVLLAAVSSILSLQRVILSPLGVRTRQDAPRLSWLRPVIAVVFVAIASTVAGAIGGVAAAPFIIFGILALCFGGTLALLNLVGPWVLATVARGQARRAGTPAKLLAARRVTEDPKAAWRQISGIAMTSFMSVFAGAGVSLLGMIGNEAGGATDQFLIADIRTGLIITVVGSFIMVACAVGVSQSADVIDRRELSRSLTMLGTELSTMDSARRRSVMSPLLITSLGSAAIAAIVLFPLVGASLIIAPLTFVVIGGVLLVGAGIVRIALMTSRPLLAGTARIS